MRDRHGMAALLVGAALMVAAVALANGVHPAWGLVMPLGVLVTLYGIQT